MALEPLELGNISDEFAALEALTSTPAPTTYAVALGMGATTFIPVRDPRLEGHAGLMQKAVTSSYKDGIIERGEKIVMLGLVLKADTTDKLTKGWNGNFAEARDDVKARVAEIGAKAALVPLLTPKTAAKAIVEAFKAGYRAAEVDPQTGALTLPEGCTPMIVTRTGQGLKTKYNVTPTPSVNTSKIATVYSVVLLPESTLAEIAADVSAFQLEMAQKRAAEASGGTPKPPNAGSDVLGLADELGL